MGTLEIHEVDIWPPEYTIKTMLWGDGSAHEPPREPRLGNKIRKLEGKQKQKQGGAHEPLRAPRQGNKIRKLEVKKIVSTSIRS